MMQEISNIATTPVKPTNKTVPGAPIKTFPQHIWACPLGTPSNPCRCLFSDEPLPQAEDTEEEDYSSYEEYSSDEEMFVQTIDIVAVPQNKPW